MQECMPAIVMLGLLLVFRAIRQHNTHKVAFTRGAWEMRFALSVGFN